MSMDCHIHMEKGDYSLEWIDSFVNKAMEMEIDEIWLLEHNYLFIEFIQMYNNIRKADQHIDKWLERKAGKRDFNDYIRLVQQVRKKDYPVKIKFGLEVCFFEEHSQLVYNITKDKELDFIVGSVHFIDNFAFDHGIYSNWKGIDVDWAYHRYFQTALSLCKSGIYNGLAHPDLIKLFGHKPDFSLTEYYINLAKELAKNKMYAEQSSGAFRRCPQTCKLGMDLELIKALKTHNVKIQTASDAHQPQDVGEYIKELENILLNI